MPKPLPVIEDSLIPTQAPAPPVKEAYSGPSGEPKFVVQIISTPNREDASSARNKVMDAGFPAGVFEADLGKKGKWYRIYVGPYDTESEAQAVLGSVQGIPGFASSFVKPLE
jgi:cell division septation protein DedD